jgi:hypothetical protein
MNTYLNSTSLRFIIAFLAIIAISLGVVEYLHYLDAKQIAYE